GKGYPDGIAGEKIPIGGRIISVADAFDAMTTDRPYRRALPLDEAFRRLNEGAGTQFDSGLIEPFIIVIKATGLIS
ncbi:MAG: HD-GYP domain-containing protein, partial [bacterium]